MNMPTYEYRCEACGNKFEKFQSITAAPIRKCPKCGKNKVRRLIGTGAGLIFKGSGFYITDYRSDSYKNAAKSESGGSSSSGDAGSKSADSGAAASGGKKSEPAAPPASESKPSSPRKKSGK
jgi:putative FmdB family regulatory protein